MMKCLNRVRSAGQRLPVAGIGPTYGRMPRSPIPQDLLKGMLT